MNGYEEVYLIMMNGTLKLSRRALTRVPKEAWGNELTTIIRLIQEVKYLAECLTGCPPVSTQCQQVCLIIFYYSFLM